MPNTMFKKILCLSIILFTFSCKSEGLDIDKAFKKEASVLSYNIKVAKKSYFKGDTIKTAYSIILNKNPLDSLYSYDFKITSNKEIFINYENSLWVFNNVDSSYYKTSKFNSILNELIVPNVAPKDSNSLDSLNTFIIEQNDSIYYLQKNFKDIQDFKNIRFNYSISKEQMQILEISNSMDFQGSNQFFNYNIEDFKINKDDVFPNLKNHLDNLIQSYKPRRLNEKSTPNYPKIIEDHKGVFLNSEQEQLLSSLESEIYVLDYWYLGCYPCLKMIPILNKIEKDYSSSGVNVIGMNIIDSLPKKEDQIKAYTDNNKLNYGLFFTKDSPVDINEFPTLFILNKNLEVLEVFSGYDKDKEQDLRKAIDKHLLKL